MFGFVLLVFGTASRWKKEKYYETLRKFDGLDIFHIDWQVAACTPAFGLGGLSYLVFASVVA